MKRHLFRGARLVFPTILEELAKRLNELAQWLFSTQNLTTSPGTCTTVCWANFTFLRANA